MRLWSIHPKYLDTKGLVALWREALLAKAVLENNTSGYKNHPQLIRFKASKNPVSAINQYLEEVFNEAQKRNFTFNKNKFTKSKKKIIIEVTSGQLTYEFKHLLNKLKFRAPEIFIEISKNQDMVAPHPMFKEICGEIENWEKPIDLT